jgi:DNA-binding MarR family transcriptional regulator
MTLAPKEIMTRHQVEVLRLLSGRERWSIGEIASALGVSSAATTKAVTRLERKGMVIRTGDTVDRRYVIVRLTPAAVDAVRQVAYEA